MLRKILLMLSLIVLNTFANDIFVKDAYIRAVPPNVPNSASFMKITNFTDKTVYLKSVTSNVAKKIELHEHIMSNGMMKMQQIKEIKIPARSSTELKPGGLHVMLLGLHKNLKAKDIVDFMTLNFSDGTTITIKNVPVKTVMMGMKH